MTHAVTLTIHDSDRVRPLQDGRVSIEGIDLTVVNEYPRTLFPRVAGGDPFAVTEMSLATFTIWSARGDCPYVGIPVFPSRCFRHNNLFVNTASGIDDPSDLVGASVGLFTEYQMTMAVTIRGMLSDEYGVEPEDVAWYTARPEKFPIDLPEGVEKTVIPEGDDLRTMVEDGELDAIIGGFTASDFGPTVERLFPDFRAAEADYYRRTGVFPIMHTLVVHEDLYERTPWVAERLYHGFVEAKDVAVEEMDVGGLLRVTLPWLIDHLEETKDLMGDDFWPYGFTANSPELATLTRYVDEQGLSGRRVEPEELFVEELHET